ncbi:AAEL017534-PA [Aedes aegypti]|uniref:Odorant receptor n=2 Tax=Aedes aegypti TaxID=7159 RepID=A0A1S7UEE5_AEDAE|nr:AAEL017534-PA [Aedes aegypti]DAA80396.1 TPA_exp: odorant receptor 56 [Aedes aegypti]
MTTKRMPPFRLMSASLKLCKWLGLWHEVNLSSPCWQTVFIMCSILFWFILPGCLYITRGEKTLRDLLKSILEVFAMSVIVSRLMVHMFNRKKLQACFVDLREAISTFENYPHENVQRILRHLLKSADYLVKIYVSIVFIQASVYGVVPAVLTTYQYCTSDEIIRLPSAVMDADYILFDHTTSYWIWMLVTIVSLIVEYLMLGSVSAQECLFWNLLHHTSCLFKMVCLEIARLDQYTDPNQFRERLACIVPIHEVCFKCARCLENVLNPLLALWYCTCIVQTCYLLFAISMIDDIVVIASMMFVLQYTVFLIFSFSMLGAELMEESARVSEAVYNTHWYMRKATESRLLLFIMMRTNRPVGIRAAKFFFVNRSTFADAMKTAFSYFTIMQRFYGEK